MPTDQAENLSLTLEEGIIGDMFGVNFSLPVYLQIYLCIFFIITFLILIIHTKRIIDHLHTKVPFYWFIGLMALNLCNILFTLIHYNYRSGTFEGKSGKKGLIGIPGDRGEYRKCTTCDENIIMDIHYRTDILQKMVVQGKVGEIGRPFTRLGFFPLGDMIFPNNTANSNRKKVYVVSGHQLKHPVYFSLVAIVPAVSNMKTTLTYIWEPQPSPGYKALGNVITNKKTPPPNNVVQCVKKSCLQKLDVGDGHRVTVFLWQDMRSKSGKYLFYSFWDTPMNTFYVSFPQKSKVYNDSLYYNIVDGNNRYLKKIDGVYKPIPDRETKIKKMFDNLASPLNLEEEVQNVGFTGQIPKNRPDVISLSAAIEHYFPGGFKFKISVNSTGDMLGGKRLNESQKRILFYSKIWLVPNKPMFMIHNKCLMKTRLDARKKEFIQKIKRVYTDFNYLLASYGDDVSELRDFLKSHMDRLKKEMRHIPDFTKKLDTADFHHFSVDRLMVLERELRNIHQGALTMTSAETPERRQKYFDLVRALKHYDLAKSNYDEDRSNGKCKKEKMEDVVNNFNAEWDKIRHLFLNDSEFKVKLQKREFESMSESKLEKLTGIFYNLVNLFEEARRNSCM